MSSRAQKGTATVLLLWLAVFGSIVVWIGAQVATDRVRTSWPEQYPLLLLPNGRYLAAASLGFRTVLADTIYLWSIQYYGHRRTPEGRRYLEHIYNTISDLDPRFIDAYTTGALVMASDMQDPELAIKLLERGIERNPDNWLLPLEAGWYSYLNLRDYEAAERYYAQAERIPGVPAWAARLRAHMIQQQGNLQAAMLEWDSIRQEAEDAGDEFVAGIAEQRVADLFTAYAVEQIEAAIERFEAAQGRKPETLAVLVRSGYLTTVVINDDGQPVNYDGDPLRYNPTTGEITDPRSEQARR